jgi:hypothetical protein
MKDHYPEVVQRYSDCIRPLSQEDMTRLKHHNAGSVWSTHTTHYSRTHACTRPHLSHSLSHCDSLAHVTLLSGRPLHTAPTTISTFPTGTATTPL